MERPGYLVLGRVVRIHGVRGEVKVVPLAAPWAPFGALRRFWLGPPGGPYRTFEVEAARPADGAILLKLAGLETPEAVRFLVGWELAVPRDEAPPPPAGTFYHYDIVGLEVVHQGRPLGRVHDILETPAHDVYVVQGDAGEWMLPATQAHIQRIDLPAGRIEIQPAVDVAGLLAGGEESAEAV